MILRAFLLTLQESGRVSLPILRELQSDETEGAVDLLREFDAVARRRCPLTAPAFDPVSALWAAETLFRACQFLAGRDVSANVVREFFRRPGPSQDPICCYSVDLTFRYLPDLVKLATGLSLEDPLTVGLQSLCAAWPLSSVGVELATAPNLEAVVASPALLALYVDRIFAREDVSRLGDERVRDAVGAALGLHTNLHPRMHAALLERTTS